MKIKHITTVPMTKVTMEGVDDTQIQWLFGKEDSAENFYMRRFLMAPGGKIPLHGHPWEHEIYILRGQAEVFTDSEKQTISAGNCLYVPSDEPHGYRNIGDEDLEFLCIVPKKATT